MQVWPLVQYMPQNSRQLQDAANLGEICASIARGQTEAEKILGCPAHGPGLHPPYSPDMAPSDFFWYPKINSARIA